MKKAIATVECHGDTLDEADDSPFRHDSSAEPLDDKTSPRPSEVCLAEERPRSAGPMGAQWPSEPRYDYVAPLGQGGMGEVRLLQDRWLERSVAFKRLRRDYGLRDELHQRFYREICIQGQLEHPSMVPVYDVGVDAMGLPFFTMRHLRGQTLEAILQAVRRGDSDACRTFHRHRLLTIFVAVCQGVEFAHQKGVIHRDIKPANIMVGHFGEVYVLDWGIAKALEAPEPIGDGVEVLREYVNATRVGTVMGTAGYMAPEQHESGSGAHTKLSDVYALGAILFELVRGQPLHDSATGDTEPMSHHEGWLPVEGTSDVPEALESLWLKATKRLPEERVSSVRELREAVERYLEVDQDREGRLLLASRCADAAEQAAVASRKDGYEGLESRKLAMEEVGRALALDPANAKASRVLLALTEELPGAPPVEVVKAEADAHDASVKADMRRMGWFFALVNGTVALLMTFGWCKGWLWAFVVFSFAGAVAILNWIAHQRSPAERYLTLSFAALQCAVLSTCPILGVAVSFPGILSLVVLMLHVQWAGTHRRKVVLFTGLSIFVMALPMVAEGFRWIPSHFDVPGPNEIRVYSTMAHLDPLFLRLAVLAGYLSLLGLGVQQIWNANGALARAERDLDLQTWQFLQLLPDGLRMSPESDK